VTFVGKVVPNAGAKAPDTATEVAGDGSGAAVGGGRGGARTGSIQMFNDGDMFSLGLWANWEYKDNGTIQTVSIPLAKSGPQEGADILSR